jgi:putative redox protein
MTISISFPGGVAVDATIGSHTIHTDQPEPLGGDTAMSPFDIFLSSIGLCMGFYALRFCQQRGIATDDLDLKLEAVRDPDGKHVDTISAYLHLPAAFPEKYQDAIRRAVDQCSVKRHLQQPPVFELTLHEGKKEAVQ